MLNLFNVSDMLGIRLSAEAEAALANHAREVGRQKSVLARDWIMERLERESIDEQMRRAARILAAHDRPGDYTESGFDD
jgi:predicted DNA-binding protein